MAEESSLRAYTRAVTLQKSHVGKVVQFLRFLEEAFLVTHTDYELEQRADDALLQVRGRIDTVIGDTLFEFKTNLRREMEDARTQLRNYLRVFHNRHPARRCVGIATDGIQFHVFEPHYENSNIPSLQLIESQDISRLSHEDAVLW
jgi:hypothetical protein